METFENMSVWFSMSTAGYTLQCVFMTEKKFALAYCILKDEKK